MGYRLHNERGVTYLFLMFAIVLIGLSTTAAARQWKAMVQRELEADLLSKGIEIQNALALYSATMKAGRVVPGEVYPQSLAELTRLPKPFLRKAYADPMTHGDWEYVRSPTGGIMGVRSKSRGRPFKKHDFPQAVRHLAGRVSYSEWIFQHPNPSTAGLLPFGPASAPPMMAPGQSAPVPSQLPPDMLPQSPPPMPPEMPSQMPPPELPSQAPPSADSQSQ
ncbi:MAG TPA: type II secretion system protein [Nitrospira sp.]|nr:type II secretion system protein [Nitrospira sp.]